ncbi:MAG: hypothetical protein WC977_02055 [Anaerovoracaceae bacterium]|jgi:hypothetical protein
MTATSRSSNLSFRFIILGSMLSVALLYLACGPGTQVRLEAAGELCGQVLATSLEIRTQAAKVNLEPLELARRTCDAAILATKLAEANLPHLEGIAGATSSPSMALAGAAGSGG